MFPRESSVEETLRAIEHRVVNDVWIGRAKRAAGAALTAVLGMTSVTGVALAEHAGHRVALIAHGLGILASLSSVAGLRIRRFTWSCAAAQLCAVATVITVGAFWWYRTGTAGVPWPTTLAAVAAGLLTAGWIGVLLTPLELSQPDMRAYARAEH
ncbi:hypothetical protein JN086_04270 [Mycolicibacterium austroafricanum]|jgi:hypothetical protein|uniref:Uncharacterized protein n=1 Tax=Mycolicibacterium austroafricanum TaxID=39687 RepID=A0ABT8H9J3_MYCAO|nr:hypothetical protein [Mycolicibacterium austroafricanum]MDN4517440.1 hypothetical protein [Mycolicibacterium austroafricanum]QRZ07590.1 hypothetical protein JN090_03265 [Mycolicibacterium austroafricanum]QZT69253.1 hypothetical protein JN086_04270 [Mycolicibacterium austroafricanum]